MTLRIIIALAAAATASAQPARTLSGREVTIVTPETDDDGFVPKGEASVCLEGAQRQCYTAPKGFGRGPRATVVQVTKDLPALFFSAASGGVSQSIVHFAILRLGTGKDLENLFMSNVDVSDQSQYAFWTEPSISDAKIFVTADYIWGRDEAHFSGHRYIISAYLFEDSRVLKDRFYYLEDRYMTVHRYPLDKQTRILDSERGEITACLRRVIEQRR